MKLTVTDLRALKNRLGIYIYMYIYICIYIYVHIDGASIADLVYVYKDYISKNKKEELY